MKPNRDAIENIVRSLDTGTLVDMLASKGIHIGEPQEESPLWSSEEEENPQAWNNIKIDIPQREKQPLHSPEKYLKPKVEEVRPEYIASETPPDMEPWMVSGGVPG